jgi:hypothetical protein
MMMNVEEKKNEMLNKIYEMYVEYQQINDNEAGYATYRCVSASRIAEQIMKFKEDSDDSRKKYEYQNAGLKETVTEKTLLPICEKYLAEVCKAEDGWVKIVKKGETAYYNPKHVREIEFFSGDVYKKYDPMTAVSKVTEKMRAETKLFKKGVNFDSSLTLFGKYWGNGNFNSRCCFNHKVKF